MGIYSYFDVRDFALLAEAALQAQHLHHEVFLVAAEDSGHADPTAEVLDRYYPQAQLRYPHLGVNTPFVTCEKARRLLGFAPRISWRNR